MKRLIVILSVIVLMLTFVPVVSAGTQGSCSPASNKSSLRVWENVVGDTGDGNDSIWLWCNRTAPVGASDLSQWAHTLPGGCHSRHPFHGANWNDCIDSYSVYGLGSYLWCLRWWTNAGYGGSSSWVHGAHSSAQTDFAYTFDEEISSIAITNDGNCGHP